MKKKQKIKWQAVLNGKLRAMQNFCGRDHGISLWRARSSPWGARAAAGGWMRRRGGRGGWGVGGRAEGRESQSRVAKKRERWIEEAMKAGRKESKVRWMVKFLPFLIWNHWTDNGVGAQGSAKIEEVTLMRPIHGNL